MRVVVAGRGKVGRALAVALGAIGEEISSIYGRDGLPKGALAGAELVLVCVPDAAIAEAARALAEARVLVPAAVVLHTAGALGPSALAPLRGLAHLGTFHPLQTFHAVDAPPPLSGVPFAIDGDDEALFTARELATKLGGAPLRIAEEARALYHAAAVLACGHLSLLGHAAAKALASAAGIDEGEALRHLGPILARTIENLAQDGFPGALTGPVARNDRETIARHIDALRALDPKLAAAYEALVATASPRA